MRFPVLVPFLSLVLAAAACGDLVSTSDDALAFEARTEADFPPAPATPTGPLDPALAADLDLVFASLETSLDRGALARVGAAGDPRVGWLLADLTRFITSGPNHDAIVDAWDELTGVRVGGGWAHGFLTDHLIAWDLEAPPGYVDWKRQVFELVDPRWAPLFADPDATIDWRWVSWGGVLVDDRPLDRVGSPCPNGCIPALNDPELTDAAAGRWYADDRIVFGVVVGDEAVAFPRNIMEVHEMVNTTIGGRRVGIPYCTLCGSAQAYFTDDVAEGVDLAGNETYELRTSGLLSRSNKVMFELHTMSVFDTFTGEAVTGPLRAAGVDLEQLTVRTATWGDWKAAHPDTRIVAEDGGIGRTYAADPLRGRDDDGPIFPIGDTDPRLGVHESVIGVVLDDGTALAFSAVAVGGALAAGEPVEFEGVRIETDGAGFQAVDADSGEPIATHQAFWFAWSQFHPDTLIWGR